MTMHEDWSPNIWLAVITVLMTLFLGMSSYLIFELRAYGEKIAVVSEFVSGVNARQDADLATLKLNYTDIKVELRSLNDKLDSYMLGVDKRKK